MKQRGYESYKRILSVLFFLIASNCSEPTSKMLRISSVWRIRQIKFQKQS